MIIHPLKTFVDNRASAWFWFILFVITVLAGFAQSIFIVKALKEPEKIVVIGDDKTHHVAVARSYPQAEDEKRFCAYLAVKAYFDRNPAGFDNMDLLNQIFLPKAKKQIETSLKNELELFASKKIHQKSEVVTYRFVPADGERRILANVTVVLHLVGNLGSKEIRHTKEVEVILDMWKNPDIGNNGRLLYAVNGIEIKEKQ